MSYGFDGYTTFRPGMWHRIASRLWLCWAAADRPPPPAVVMVSGTVAEPPNMYLIFAAWFTIWSMATQMKSMNIRSTIGRRPVTASPTPEADDGLLADRRVDDASLAELLLEPAEGAEHAAEGADVLAGAEHVVVFAHPLADGLVERHHVGQAALGGRRCSGGSVAVTGLPSRCRRRRGSGRRWVGGWPRRSRWRRRCRRDRRPTPPSASVGRHDAGLGHARFEQQIGSRFFHTSTSSSVRYFRPRFCTPWWL